MFSVLESAHDQGTSLVVHWLRLHTGVWVWCMVRELRSHMPMVQRKQNMKQKHCCKEFSEDLKSSSYRKGLPRWLSRQRISCQYEFILWVRRFLEEENSNSLQNSCLKHPTDRRAWRATVQRVTKSQTQLSK